MVSETLLDGIPDQEMREILYVWNYRDWGGAQIYFLSLMKEAQSRYRVTAVLPSDSESKLLYYLNSLQIPYEFLPPSPRIDPANGLLGKISSRITILRSESCLVRRIFARTDLRNMIVHVDLGFWQSFFTLWRLCMKTNVFVTIHTGLPFYTGWRAWRWKIKGKILSRFSGFHIIASNNEAKKSLRPYVGADNFDRIEVTYSGIDPVEIDRVREDRPEKTVIRRRKGLPESVPILMTVGQFIERKGCWVLLESLKQLTDAGQEFSFVWLSTTMPGVEILNRINEYGLGDSFRLMDAEQIGETRDELLTLLSVADIFILASLQEGLPIALTEAMALGLPSIATNVNAIPEAIEHMRNGILVAPNDPVQLKEAIQTLLNDPQLRGAFGQAAKTTAFEKFNAKISATQTMKLYNDVWKTKR